MKNHPFHFHPRKNEALRLAGAIAIGTAGYHAISGNAILRKLPLQADDMDFVTGTYQLGTMGWLAGAALLIGAAGLKDQSARNLIVGVTVVLFGIPAFGTLALTGGEITLGGTLLSTVVALALAGRRLPAAMNVLPAVVVDQALAQA